MSLIIHLVRLRITPVANIYIYWKMVLFCKILTIMITTCWDCGSAERIKSQFLNSLDIDECASTNCGSGTCVNGEGSFTCTCPQGYEFKDDTCQGECYFPFKIPCVEAEFTSLIRWVIKLAKLVTIDPPGHGRFGGHYFHAWCPYVRTSFTQNKIALHH